MGDTPFVKTTLELPDALIQKAKAMAARNGQTLNQLVQEALTEKLARTEGVMSSRKPWMTLAGGLRHLHAENIRIDLLIESEFEQIEPDDRQ